MDNMTAEQALAEYIEGTGIRRGNEWESGFLHGYGEGLHQALTAPRVPVEAIRKNAPCELDINEQLVWAEGWNACRESVLTTAPAPAVPRPHDDLLGHEKAALAPADDPLTCDTCGTATDNPWHYSSGERRHLHACDKCWPAVNPADKLAKLRERVKVLESALESLLYEREAAERRQRASKLLGADNQCLRGGSDE